MQLADARKILKCGIDIVVLWLFRNFDFPIVDPANPWKSHNCGLWLQSEMWLRVTERAARPTT